MAEVNALKSIECSGYISPEYGMEGKYSEKSDVFSFGVLILEIVSGRRNSSFVDEEWSMNLLGYVRQHYLLRLTLLLVKLANNQELFCLPSLIQFTTYILGMDPVEGRKCLRAY
jgi:serine/threonine protein kinase